MGQNQSQPSSRCTPSPASPTCAATSPSDDVPTPEPRRQAASTTNRTRLSNFLKGNRTSLMEPIDELGRSEVGPSGTTSTSPAAPVVDRVPPLTVKTRSSIRRLLQRRSMSVPASSDAPRPPAATSGSLGRSSIPPNSANGTSHQSPQLSESGAISMEKGKGGSEFGVGGPSAQPPWLSGNAQPSTLTPLPKADEAPSSTPPEESISDDPSIPSPDCQPDASTSSSRGHTRREIAMLSGTAPSSMYSTKATTSPPSPVHEASSPLATPISKLTILEEDPAALPLSQSPSWHSTGRSDHGPDDESQDVTDVDVEVDPLRPSWGGMETDLATPIQDRTVDPGSIVADPGSSDAGTHSLSSGYQLPPPSSLTDGISQLATAPSSIAHHGAPVVIPPPLPIIPAGTTMIIQGVVQAADDGGRVRRTADPRSTGGATATRTSREARAAHPTATATSSNAHAHLSGTFGNDSAEGSGQVSDSDTPGGAADLLGALLIAAASATANMLLSDPPGASSPPHDLPPTPAYTSPIQVNTEPLSSPQRSSVGVGPRPRPSTMAARNDESLGDFFARDRPRPRSLVSNLRERLLGGTNLGGDREEEAAFDRLLRAVGDGARRSSRWPTDDEEPESVLFDPARDPIESLRERIANELMRALAARENGIADYTSVAGPSSGSGIRSTTFDDHSPLSLSPPSPGGLSALPLSIPPATSARADAAPPPEGSFERFLHDTSAELRSTLVERMNSRDQTTTVPIPAVPAAEGLPAATTGDADAQAASPSEPRTTDQVTPLVRFVNRPSEGVIEPRLNWWRMHRFPARSVAAPPSDPPPTTMPSLDATILRSPITSISPSIPLEPRVNSTTASTNNSTRTESAILIPVIVVGIRTAPTVLVQEIGALAATRPPENLRSMRDALPPLRSDSSSAPVSPPALGPDRQHRPWQRAVESITRAIATRRRISERERNRRSIPIPVQTLNSFGPIEETSTVPQAPDAPTTPPADASRDRTRNYLIWVIGGYYPESHPILTSPNILLNQFDQDDFWGLAELLGQVKPPVASKDDIERAGLQIIKAADLAQFEKEGKVTWNTSEKCLICLGDYEPEEDLRIMSCKHVFHQPCVDKWLEVGRNNCPACRTKGVDVVDSTLPESSTADPHTVT